MPSALAPSQSGSLEGSSKVVSSKVTRVMLVDDSLTTRTIFSRIIAAEPDLVLAGRASTAEAALAQLSEAKPHIILLDLEMPGMGGMVALPQMLEKAPSVEILVVSSLTEVGARHTIQALSLGAADTLPKPLPGGFDREYRAALLQKIRALSRQERQPEPARQHYEASGLPAVTSRTGKRARLMAIGASTGGVHAINTILRGMPSSFTLPIVITQHLPASFVPVFAQQLQATSGRPTAVAVDGMPLRSGTITVAPGHAHVLVQKSGEELATSLSREQAPAGCWPAVDPMLTSIAAACDGAAVALILSGMGRDGLLGASALHQAGGTILVQDAESCAVWGMPRAVAAAGIAAGSMPPERMSAWLLAHFGAAG